MKMTIKAAALAVAKAPVSLNGTEKLMVIGGAGYAGACVGVGAMWSAIGASATKGGFIAGYAMLTVGAAKVMAVVGAGVAVVGIGKGIARGYREEMERLSVVKMDPLKGKVIEVKGVVSKTDDECNCPVGPEVPGCSLCMAS